MTLASLAQGLFGDTPGLEPHAILPTVGLNVGRLEAFQAQLLLWDLGGAPGLRSIWDKYYADSHALLFVVDASQPARCAVALAACLGRATLSCKRQLSTVSAGRRCLRSIHRSLGPLSAATCVLETRVNFCCLFRYEMPRLDVVGRALSADLARKVLQHHGAVTVLQVCVPAQLFFVSPPCVVLPGLRRRGGN